MTTTPALAKIGTSTNTTIPLVDRIGQYGRALLNARKKSRADRTRPKLKKFDKWHPAEMASREERTTVLPRDSSESYKSKKTHRKANPENTSGISCPACHGRVVANARKATKPKKKRLWDFTFGLFCTTYSKTQCRI
jgi:hypothetical protein